MSTTETEKFQGKDAGMACPNCGNPLFSGLADGNVLVCRDGEGNGCQIAVNPDHPEGETMAAKATGAWDEVASPEVGPPNNPTEVPAGEISPEQEASLKDPWEPPTSAPQAANFDPPEADPVKKIPAPLPAPPEPAATPKEPGA